MKILFLLSIIFLLYLSLFAESEWTVLVYMAADNSLFNAAFKDINEMEAVGSSDSVNIIIQVDPVDPDVYPSSDFDFSEARRYFITYDENPDSIGSMLLDELGEINSGDPNSLTEFANWGFALFPSKKKMLVIWDHGNGWTKDDEIVKYVCTDNTSGDQINVANGELKWALASIDHHINIITFDACLMQMPEVIGEVEEYCDFVIGSEETVPEDGIFYGYYKEFSCSNYGIFNYLVEHPKCTPEEFSVEIVLRYVNSYTIGCQNGTNISMSAVKTSWFDDFTQLILNFSDSYSDTTYYNLYETTRSECFILNYNNVDAWQFFTHLSENSTDDIASSAQAIVEVIDSMIVSSIAFYNGTIKPELGRMSISFPATILCFNWEQYHPLRFVHYSRWDRFLCYYYKEVNVKPKIISFDITARDRKIYFYWEVASPTNLKYTLGYTTFEDTTYISLIETPYDSFYIHKIFYSTTLPSGSYTFHLTVIDEFKNEREITKPFLVSKDQIFVFHPNPYVITKETNGKFIFSTGNSEKAKIFIYNFAGELVEKLKTLCEENSTCELPFSPDILSSGIYFCLLKTGDRTNILKLAIIR